MVEKKKEEKGYFFSCKSSFCIPPKHSPSGWKEVNVVRWCSLCSVKMSSMAVIACVCVGDWALLESSLDLYLLLVFLSFFRKTNEQIICLLVALKDIVS